MALTEQQIVFALACIDAALSPKLVQLLSSLFDRLPKREALQIAEGWDNVRKARLLRFGFKPSQAISPFEITPEQFTLIRHAVNRTQRGRSLGMLRTMQIFGLARDLAKKLND